MDDRITKEDMERFLLGIIPNSFKATNTANIYVHKHVLDEFRKLPQEEQDQILNDPQVRQGAKKVVLVEYG